jgi:hypothetical protein
VSAARNPAFNGDEAPVAGRKLCADRRELETWCGADHARQAGGVGSSERECVGADGMAVGTQGQARGSATDPGIGQRGDKRAERVRGELRSAPEQHYRLSPRLGGRADRAAHQPLPALVAQ